MSIKSHVKKWKADLHRIFDQPLLPSMSSTADGILIRELIQRATGIERAVEFGPWLGALTQHLAPVFELHVVDNFVWTADHNKRVPDLLQPGESFKDVFIQLMKHRGLSPVIHQDEFASFSWSDGKVDICLIDYAKSPSSLRECLLSIAQGLSKDSLVLLKNGLHVRFLPMMLYVQGLVEQSVLTIEHDALRDNSNMLVLRVNQTSARLAKALEAYSVDDKAIGEISHGPMTVFPAMQTAILGHYALTENWQAAYHFLDQVEGSADLQRNWKQLQKTLMEQVSEITALEWFSAVMRAHNDESAEPKPHKPFAKNLDATLGAFWVNNKGKSWRAASMRPEILKTAFDYGYMKWASKIQDYVRDKSVLDVGCGPGLHGLGYLTAGASRYLGIDPIIKMDKDRVKNLSQKSAKVPFGWTPQALSELIEPWQVQPEPIESLSEDDKFDFAVMHNVTEHLHQIELVFAEIAKRLKPDGLLLYNHHNFYSWNGHHLPPKTVSAIKAGDPAQAAMMDWGHVDYDPEPEHYIARGLNRIRLDDILALTARYFEIVEADEIPSRPETGLGRLTDKIRNQHPDLTDRDFETQNLLCVARVKSVQKSRGKKQK